MSSDRALWGRNALFIGISLAGSLVVAGGLLKRDRVTEPETFHRERFEVTTVSSASSTEAASQPPTNDFFSTLNQLNAEFHAHWKEKELEPAPRADHLTFARRLSLALVGTVPSLEEIRALEMVAPEHRLDWWTSHLLEDRRYSDYFAERLARVYVGNEQGPFLVFRRRRFTLWLSDQLHQNTPYDEIVRSLLSEDGIWTGKPATNFVTATADPNNDNEPDPIRLAGRTARAFLGMRIDCLQCHDDKLGTIMVGSSEDIHAGTQADFHQLAAFFGPTDITLVGVHDGTQSYEYKYLDAEKESVIPPAVPFGEDLLDRHGRRREQLARWVTHPKNKPFARATVNRVWALLFGKPLVEPIDDIPLVGRFPPGMQLLADDFVDHNFDLARLIRLIAASDAFWRESRADFEITEQHEQAWAAFPLSRLRPEQMAGSLIQAASLTTINGDAHIVWRLIKSGQTSQFVERYGDLGEDEFTVRGSTIPQRLLMMNGELVKERTEENPILAASTRIATLTGKPEKQVDAAYLAILSRRPSAEEMRHFASRLRDRQDRTAAEAMEDLYWTLLNSTEFSWNH
jgi:hypothetical protein